MAKCLVCGKTTQFGRNVSHARNRTRRTFKPNLQKIRIVHEGKKLRAWVCTRCLKAGKVTKAV